MPGIKGNIIIALKPASEAVETESYKKWNLTADDYPLIGTCTWYQGGGTFPDFGGRVSTATGRVFSVGGGANSISSWTPTEIFPKTITLKSSTESSTKKFKITVDDNGTLTAKEVQ